MVIDNITAIVNAVYIATDGPVVASSDDSAIFD
jgi:hypothetical protein